MVYFLLPKPIEQQMLPITWEMQDFQVVAWPAPRFFRSRGYSLNGVTQLRTEAHLFALLVDWALQRMWQEGELGLLTNACPVAWEPGPFWLWRAAAQFWWLPQGAPALRVPSALRPAPSICCPLGGGGVLEPWVSLSFSSSLTEVDTNWPWGKRSLTLVKAPGYSDCFLLSYCKKSYIWLLFTSGPLFLWKHIQNFQ